MTERYPGGGESTPGVSKVPGGSRVSAEIETGWASRNEQAVRDAVTRARLGPRGGRGALDQIFLDAIVSTVDSLPVDVGRNLHHRMTLLAYALVNRPDILAELLRESGVKTRSDGRGGQWVRLPPAP